MFWDVFGEQGHPVRATVSDLGPLLLSRILNLNDTQAGVLALVFKIADDNGLLLLDLKDLRAMLQHVGDNAQTFQTNYGNVSAASIGAIQRGLLALEQQGGDEFLGEPMLNVDDLLQTDGGRGVVNILAADKLMQCAAALLDAAAVAAVRAVRAAARSRRSATSRSSCSSSTRRTCCSPMRRRSLLDKIEQVVRLIRSKGVGVFFVTQNPLDVPDIVLGQLGNRVQHALRAFTPRDQKAVKAAAETMRANPKIDTEKAITELGVGEALVSFLDEKGRPDDGRARVRAAAGVAHRADHARGARARSWRASPVKGVYDKTVDRESAYEKLQGPRGDIAPAAGPRRRAAQRGGGFWDSIKGSLGGLMTGSGRKDSIVEAMAKSAARTVGSTVGREIVRGVLGSLLGGKRR